MRRPDGHRHQDASDSDGPNRTTLRETYRLLESARSEYEKIRADCARQREMMARQREFLKELSFTLSSPECGGTIRRGVPGPGASPDGSSGAGE